MKRMARLAREIPSPHNPIAPYPPEMGSNALLLQEME